MPKGRKVTWAPAAKADLLDIWRYHADSTSLDTADDVLRQIYDAAVGLNRVKTPGRPRKELLPDLRSVLRRQHTIFFRLEGDCVEIVRVLHERRDVLALFRAEQE